VTGDLKADDAVQPGPEGERAARGGSLGGAAGRPLAVRGQVVAEAASGGAW
jgi:hypothetical protein